MEKLRRIALIALPALALPFLPARAQEPASDTAAGLDREFGEERLSLAHAFLEAGDGRAAERQTRDAMTFLGPSPEADGILAQAASLPDTPGVDRRLERRREVLDHREVSERLRFARRLGSDDEESIVRQIARLHTLSPADPNVASFRARQDARHARWEDAYVAASPRWRLRANLPWERVVDLLEQLDRLSAQIEASCPVEDLLRAPDTPLDLLFFARPEQFQKHLAEAHPGMGWAPPFFDAGENVTHAYDLGRDVATTTEEMLLHEATHHLLHARLGTAEPTAGRPHFWVSEGIACHFERLARDATTLRADRVQAAAHEDRLVPLETLLQYTQNVVNGEAALDLYAQSASLATWFLEAEDGKHREAFWRYLAEVEAGCAEEGSFAKFFPEPVATYETAWRASLECDR